MVVLWDLLPGKCEEREFRVGWGLARSYLEKVSEVAGDLRFESF